jgi:hypothetical protein
VQEGLNQRILKSLSEGTYQVSFDYIDEEKFKILTKFVHGTTSEETKRHAARLIPYSQRDEFPRTLMSGSIATDFFRERVKRTIENEPHEIERLRCLALISLLPRIISTIGENVRPDFISSSYIGPMRAAGERYYRWQELAVDRLDPKGENFAMYVMSLTQGEQDRFSILLSEYFGYELKATRESGHASLLLAEKGTNDWFNIADVGFGFSQILPVIAQIHASQRKGIRVRARSGAFVVQRAGGLIAVEQPELHLHPAFQTKIADLFCASASTAKQSQDSGRRFIVETHSEALVNRLSELVAANRISSEDVVIYIFEKDDFSHETHVRRVDIDGKGDITNWPYGFFHY